MPSLYSPDQVLIVTRWVNALTAFDEVTRPGGFYLDESIVRATADLKSARDAVIACPERPKFPFAPLSQSMFGRRVRSLAMAWEAAHREAA